MRARTHTQSGVDQTLVEDVRPAIASTAIFFSKVTKNTGQRSNKCAAMGGFLMLMLILMHPEFDGREVLGVSNCSAGYAEI